jgi:DNA polymerase III epsilon subunit-like protein
VSDAMIDLETLGTQGNARILQIGAITFDPFDCGTPSQQLTHVFNGYVRQESQPDRFVFVRKNSNPMSGRR